MRTTRAYVAGFGTAGSVLAGASILFVLASAIVAFEGWPRIASQASVAAVQVTAAPAPPSRVSRRLRAVTTGGTLVPAAGAGGGSRGSGSRPRVTTPVGTPTHPPVTVTVPTGSVRTGTGTAGNGVTKTRSQAGSAVGR